MTKRSFTLLDLQDDPRRDVALGDLELGPADLGLPGCKVSKRTLRGGLRDGVELLHVELDGVRVVLLPQRGMGIWKAWVGELELSWRSPVRGPVHPRIVPVAEPSGLGWLDGFDELVARCGLYNNGAPEFGEQGQLLLPLHGRIANTPAHRLTVEVDADAGEIAVTGVVDECRFHFQKLRLTSTARLRRGDSAIRITDEVTNLAGVPGEMELLYHINVGPPILGPGAEVIAPLEKLVPRNQHSARGVETWGAFGQPSPGVAEEAFFCRLLQDDAGWTQALLRSGGGDRGMSVRYRADQLPCFTLWKNPAAEADGYVTGLEPGTNFPNTRSFESVHGRTKKLAPGDTARFELELNGHADTADVADAQRTIERLQSSAMALIMATPDPEWTTDA